MSTTENAFADIAWLEPWTPLDPRAREPLEQELSRELAPGHALFGRPARAIARCDDRDDVLFSVDAPQQLAVVHLTYSREKSADSPHTMIFETISDFVDGCMMPDHAEFSDDES